MQENKAAELGPSRFSWWKDWRGECVAIVASGPSTNKAEVEKLRNRIHVIALKENVDLCPWADVVYGCDAAWWKHRKGLPEFGGLKIAWAGDKEQRGADFPGICKVEIEKKIDQVLFDEPARIGSGGNSGFHASNIAAQFGATGILGLGFDLHGQHWYGRNNWLNANNPSSENFRRWHKAFAAAAPVFRSMGVEFINASTGSALDCFPKMSVTDALKRWGL